MVIRVYVGGVFVVKSISNKNSNCVKRMNARIDALKLIPESVNECADIDKMVREGVKGVVDAALKEPVSLKERLKEIGKEVSSEYSSVSIASVEIDAINQASSWFRWRLGKMKRDLELRNKADGVTIGLDEKEVAFVEGLTYAYAMWMDEIDELLKECEV
jgi:hypothetical protein